MITTDPNHKHTYNEQDEMSCCSLEEKINEEAEDHAVHYHSGGDQSILHMFSPSIISFVLLLAAIAFDSYFTQFWFTGWTRIAWYIVACASWYSSIKKCISCYTHSAYEV